MYYRFQTLNNCSVLQQIGFQTHIWSDMSEILFVWISDIYILYSSNLNVLQIFGMAFGNSLQLHIVNVWIGNIFSPNCLKLERSDFRQLGPPIGRRSTDVYTAQWNSTWIVKTYALTVHRKNRLAGSGIWTIQPRTIKTLKLLTALLCYIASTLLNIYSGMLKS